MRRLPAFFVLLGPALCCAGWIDAEIEAPLVLAEGGETELVAVAPEGAALAWELTEDSLFDDGDQESPLFSVHAADGPAEAFVGLRVEHEGEVAYRIARIEIANVAPTIVSVPTVVARRGRPWEYTVVAEDPGLDDAGALYVHLAENVGPEEMIATDEGVLRWTPTQKDLGLHLVRVLVEDDDGATAAQNFVLEVVDDARPFSPNPSPMPAECFRSLQPFVTVGNTNDPDGDPLLYYFEVSEDGDFEGTDLVASPAVEPGRNGFTRWMVSRALDPGGIYYWRAWATDGLQRSGEVRGALCIQPDDPPPTAPPRVIYRDGPAGNDVHYGCSAAGDAPGGGAVLCLLALLAIPRRRPR